jgi:hypothetical protein
MDGFASLHPFKKNGPQSKPVGNTSQYTSTASNSAWLVFALNGEDWIPPAFPHASENDSHENMEFNNRGILFRNNRKRQPKHPDFTGEATIDGRKYKIAGWTKQGKKAEFYSMAFTEDVLKSDEPQPESAEQADVPPRVEDNDIPF